MTRFRDWSIRTKLLLITMSVTLTALIIASGVFVAKDLMIARAEMVEHGMINAQIVADNCTAAVSFKNVADATEMLNSLHADTGVDAAWIFTPDGEVLGKFSRKQSLMPSPESFLAGQGYIFRSDCLEIYCPILLDGKLLGTVFVRENLNKLTQRYTDFAKAIGLVFAAALIASLCLLSRLQSVISKPILGLIQTAQAVSTEKNYTLRAFQLGNDELGSLVQCFNTMLDEIQERDLQLQSHRDHLEEQVLVRTEELMRVNEELTSARDRAEQSNRAKSSFLANMSHEIRTPMTAICGYADMMLEPNQTLSDRQDCLQIIRRNAAHLLELINDVLDLSKIEADKMTIERLDVDLPHLVSEVGSLLRPRAGEKGVQFEIRFGDPLPKTIKSDALRLRQILLNLLNNAVKFTSKGRISLQVSVKTHNATSSRICFAIADTGIGISQAHQARLFEWFSQADESMTRRFGGTGLGLTISRKLAHLLGGDVVVQSAQGLGSTFTLEIEGGSLAGVEMLHGVTESMFGCVTSQTPAASIRIEARILFAEDGLDNQRLISTHLRRAGAEVTIAPNGKVALELMATQRFDLVLMDMQMPVLDGYAAASQLRQRGFKQPVIALTAHAMADDRAKCIQAGCTDYLTKPIDRDKLLSTVASYLKQSEAPQTADQPKCRQEAPVPITPATDSGGIHQSSYSNDPDMKSLIEGYIQRLPIEVSKLTALLDSGEIEALRRIAHQLKGSGGGYGFSQLTQLASVADKSIKEGAQIEQVRREVQELIGYIRGIRGYNATQEAINAPTSLNH